MPDLGVYGLPGVGNAKTASWRRVIRSGEYGYLGLGRLLKGSLTRDPGNVGFETYLRAGLVLGRTTAAPNMYANSILGLTSVAFAGTGTLTVPVSVAAEIVRRFGTSGTFKLTGPPVASGVVRTSVVAFSAVNLATGVVTVTTSGVSEVHTVTISGASAGSFSLSFVDQNGNRSVSSVIQFNSSVAVIQASVNAAVAGIVVGGTDATAFTLTYSGSGFLTNPPAFLPSIDIQSALTGLTTATVVKTTAGTGASFVAGSFVQPTDGSEVPATFLPDGFPTQVVDISGTVVDTELPKMPIYGEVDAPQLLSWPTDPSLQTWLMNSLSTANGGKFTFSNTY
jgi:hypothetical protein